MNTLEELERGDGPFSIRLRGVEVTLPSPVGMDFQFVLTYLQDEFAPGTYAAGVTVGQRTPTFEAWRAHYDLPRFENARRLAYLCDRYRSALVADLRRIYDIDLGEYWRARRWQTLLDLIDHLPQNTWFAAAVGDDVEHAELMAKAIAERRAAGEDEEGPKGPGLQNWSPEVDLMTKILDVLKNIAYINIMAASKGKANQQSPKPEPRPQTALARETKQSDFRRRQAKHKDLVAQMLPHKAASEGE